MHCVLVNLRDAVAYEAVVEWVPPPNFGLRFLASHNLNGKFDPKMRLAHNLWLERRGR
jgi:hypothetical protein